MLKTTSFKYWIKSMIMYLLIPLILLICAWDINWWQGWTYSAILLTAGLVPRIIVNERNPGLMVERGNFGKAQNIKPWDKLLAPLMAISLSFPLLIVAGLDHNFKWSTVFPLWLNILGFILIIVGYAFAGWAFVENRFFSSVVRIQSDRGHKVCESGPYKIVRHPGYAGNLLALPGIVLALSSVWTIIPVIFAVVIAVIRTSLEDKTLQTELSGYRDYTHNVHYRLIPYLY